jgi:hypothetical protein
MLYVINGQARFVYFFPDRLMSKLHVANTFFEWELETQPKMSLREAFLQHTIFLQLQFLPILYADPKDLLLLSDLPDREYWSFLRAQKIATPSYFTLDDKRFHSIDKIESWGPSQLIAEWAASRDLIYSIPDWKVVQEVNSKRFSFENSPKLAFATLLTDESKAKHWTRSFQGSKVLKTCFGVSGKGHLLIDGFTPWDRIHQFLSEEWKKNLPVIAEPWVNRVLDFSTQWFIAKNRRVHYLGSTICHNDRRGQYQCNEVGNEKELFHQHFSSLSEHQKIIESLLTTIAAKGFFGNLGVDAMLYTRSEDPETILLQPIVEINARKTMGWAALAFQKQYFPGNKIRFSYVNGREGYLPNSLVLKNAKRISFARNLRIEVYN